MTDQARALRGLVEQRAAAATEASRPKSTRARTVAITSGKGGVGKSNIALNVAIALQQSGSDVCLLDANLGLGNLDVLCGLNGYWNLSHVVAGVRTLAEIRIEGPAGVHLVPGAGGFAEVADCAPHVQQKLLEQFEELEQSHDYLVIDTAAGIHRAVRRFLAAADVVLVLTTPEPTSIADSYATIKALSTMGETDVVEVVVNQASTRDEATRILERVRETARMFLHTDVESGGFIPYDTSVGQAVIRRTPFLLSSPRCPASRAVEQLARRIKNVSRVKRGRGTFFSRVWPRGERAAA